MSAIRIDIDAAGPNYDIAYLEVQPQIIELEPSMQSEDLVKIVKQLDAIYNPPKHNLSEVALLHEFGHLQDIQRPEFGYTCEVQCEKLLGAVDKIWNILLDKRLVTHRLPIGNENKNGVWKSFKREWKNLTGKEPHFADFESLWTRKKYNYGEICSIAKDLLERYSHWKVGYCSNEKR